VHYITGNCLIVYITKPAVGTKGKKIGPVVVDVSVLLFLTGALISYIIIIGDILTPFLEYAVSGHDEGGKPHD
jgi:amino acid permease